MRFKLPSVIAVLLFAFLPTGYCIGCFECLSRLRNGESDACLEGNEDHLARVQCVGSAVCAKYQYEEHLFGRPVFIHITRGCQVLRYGATCEDIFHDLREKGEILPGRHICTTCSTSFCNVSSTLKIFSVYYLCLIVLFNLVCN